MSTELSLAQELARKWWEKNYSRFVPYGWTGNHQFINVEAVLAEFAEQFRTADQNAVLQELR